ncbi:MAG TPA: sulfite exporter TauE/SafE family protein [Chromatiaceae bacterium]|jgi:uncharacterized membrane protein YfcA|nr:MAG: hypothetical protein N838_04030 [Thiohalocapsa sp. PB-PSB1]QQO55877.1 MAG: sulfite exporter TauE/SafE family protein [Thiohalocapsa sp. PB-PSB1]HBG95061.1 sulfite exporter TauE/SafE family protein [Chromatiaceae bacterium]HCS90754.1 sulfite exporter TauE/SafE family protein [Chromatiaceae bacterium]
MPDISALAVLLLAAFIHGAFGFGFPMVATPLLALMMDLRAAILIILIPCICINAVSILGEKHRLEALRIFWPIPAFSIVGSLIGTQVLLSVNSEPFRLLLALVLVAYLLVDRLHGVERTRNLPKWALALLGLGLGLMAGVINIFAPVLIVFALYTRMRPELMVAAFNLSFLTSKTGQLIGFTLNQALDASLLMQAFWALPLVLGALLVGIAVRRRIQPESYRKLLRFGLWFMAVALIWDSLRST